MKNAFLSLLVFMALISFFGFTNQHARLITDSDQVEDNAEARLPDTVPAKKAAKKPASKTVPYDSFGKPKKMDSGLRR